MLRFAHLAVALACLAPAAAGAANHYVHPTDPSCQGNSPCHASISDALQAASHGSSVIVLADIVETVNSTHGKRNIRLMGNPSSVLIDGNVTLNSAPVDGWVLRDFHLGNSVVIGNVDTSLSIENLQTRAIQVGPFTQDTTANIAVRNVTVVPGGAESITIRAEPGFDIDGTIIVEGCEVPRAVNVEVHAAANPAILAASVHVNDNQLGRGAGVRALGTISSGAASITGPVEMSNNVFTDHKLAVIVTGNVTGDISGGVTLTGNTGPWIAVLTSESNGGDLGPLTLIGNTAEEIEVVVWGDIAGPTLATDNQILDMGGVTGLEIFALLIDGYTISGSVTVQETYAPDNDIVVRAKTGNLSGTAVLEDNLAARITFEARGGGGIVTPFTVRNNQLPQDADPLSSLTIQTQTGGALAPGQVEGNAADLIRIVARGSVLGDVQFVGNTVREQGTFIGQNAGAGNLIATGNDFRGDTHFNDMPSTVRFNRTVGGMAVISGDVDARFNWWGCNEGPDEVGCGESLTGGINHSPWLVFGTSHRCEVYPTVAIDGNVLSASSGPPPPDGNDTPGSMSIQAVVGTVRGSPAPLENGQATAWVDLPADTLDTTVNATLDSETVTELVQCADIFSEIFADGFESGDTSRWGLLFEDFENVNLKFSRIVGWR